MDMTEMQLVTMAHLWLLLMPETLSKGANMPTVLQKMLNFMSWT